MPASKLVLPGGHGVAIGALKSKSVANTAFQKAAPWALRTRNVTGRLAMRAANASKAGAAVAAAAVTTRSAAAAARMASTEAPAESPPSDLGGVAGGGSPLGVRVPASTPCRGLGLGGVVALQS